MKWKLLSIIPTIIELIYRSLPMPTSEFQRIAKTEKMHKAIKRIWQRTGVMPAIVKCTKNEMKTKLFGLKL